jgi:hypothetical protein
MYVNFTQEKIEKLLLAEKGVEFGKNKIEL